MNRVFLTVIGLSLIAMSASPTNGGGLVLRTYAAGMDSTWNVNANWLPWGVPNNGAVEYHAVINSGHIVSLDLNASVTSLTVADSSRLWIANGKVLNLWGASTLEPSVVHNNSTIRIYAETSNTRIQINQGPVEFSTTSGSSGEVVMEEGVGSGYSEIYGTGSAEVPRLINNDGHIFRGAGFFQNSVSVTNHGVIVADNPNKALELAMPAMVHGGSCINDGVLRADNGATLKLNRTALSFTALYDNTDGVIEALPGSQVHIDGRTRVIGGEIKSVGSGVVKVVDNYCMFKDVTTSGTLRIAHAKTLDIAGTIANTGTMHVDTVSPSTGGFNLTSEGDAMLTGGGVIELGDNFGSYFSTSAGRRLTNVNNTIRGAGQLGIDGLSITNQGVIDANSSVAVIRIDPPSTGDFTNEGTLRATGTPGIIFNTGPFFNTGEIIVASGSTFTRSGTIQHNGGSTSVNGSMSISNGSFALSGGTLKGSGTLSASAGVDNSGGSVSPGNSVAILTITGTYTQGASGQFFAQIGGTTAGDEYDRLAVSGNVSLSGELLIETIDGYVPQANDSFTIITSNGTVSGQFATVTSGWDVQYLANAVVITPTAMLPCPADITGSGSVGVSDLLAVINAWGSCPAPPQTCPPDIDNDGLVSVSDLLAVINAWGPCPQ